MLTPGTRFGPYELGAQLGAGGMGEVYRARDTRLGRDVAIKVISPALAHDKERVRRFEQEATAAAALAHPNIIAVHDVGSVDGSPFIVSELLHGQTLRALLDASGVRQPTGVSQPAHTAVWTPAHGAGSSPAPDPGPPASAARLRNISVRRALDILTQVAHGLAAAHDKGIVHRDLKPENIFVTNDGQVKILDFGIAKLQDEGPRMTSQDTTASSTAQGTILGTLAYMAPEQLRGLAVDHRADLFAFGAIAYELLTGTRAFAGPTPIDTMTAVLTHDPIDIRTLAPGTNPALERIVERCLEKQPERRFQSASDLAFALEGSPDGTPAARTAKRDVEPASRPSRWRNALPWTVAAVALIIAAVALIASAARLQTAREPAEAWFAEIEAPSATRLLPERGMAVSDDGRAVVFVAIGGGPPQLYLRSLNRPDAVALPGTDDAMMPFWSPEGRDIAFFAQGKLKRVPVSGGPPFVICDASAASRGATWGSRGDILFAPSIYGSIYRVSAIGGVPARVTPEPRGTTGSHRFPRFLADGRRFVFNDVGNGLSLWDLDAGRALATLPRPDATLQTIVEIDGAAYELAVVPVSEPTASGQSGSTLLARRVDLASMTPIGDPRPITAVAAAAGISALAASPSGTLAVVRAWPLLRLNLFDRNGTRTGEPLPWSPLSGPRFSPDGLTIAFADRGEIATVDVRRGLSMPVTNIPGVQGGAVWSPDGQQIAFLSRESDVGIRVAAVGNGDRAETLVTARRLMLPSDWSRDGRWLAYTIWPDDSSSNTAIGVYSFEKRTSGPWLSSVGASDASGTFSPDGRWMAYQSDESGRWEVYIRPFPGPGSPTRVSTDGGVHPVWRADGNELFFVSADARVMAVSLRAGQGGGPGLPQPLMSTAVNAYWTLEAQSSFDVSPDGQRFVIATDDSPSPVRTLTTVRNWTALLNGSR